jgi:hypothetical protein
MADERKSLRSRARRRLADAASRLVTRGRFRAEAAAEQGDPRAAVTADLLLMESQQAAYVQLHKRFTERAGRGDGGLDSALDALDAMWENIRQLRGGAPAILRTLSNPDDVVHDRRVRFYADSTQLLEDAIRAVFAADLGHLAMPPERLAILVRVGIEGLVVELAQAQSPEDVAQVDQAYADIRAMFQHVVRMGEAAPAPAALPLDPIALPW